MLGQIDEKKKLTQDQYTIIYMQASLYEPDPAHSFFGSHYKALRAIKAKYDPHDLFVVAEGVGSVEWDRDLRCRV